MAGPSGRLPRLEETKNACYGGDEVGEEDKRILVAPAARSGTPDKRATHDSDGLRGNTEREAATAGGGAEGADVQICGERGALREVQDEGTPQTADAGREAGGGDEGQAAAASCCDPEAG